MPKKKAYSSGPTALVRVDKAFAVYLKWKARAANQSVTVYTKNVLGRLKAKKGWEQ